MKTKIAMTTLKKIGYRFMSAGYCDLYKIVNGSRIDPQYYNCGVYGWNCDIYTEWTQRAGAVAISTGYRNMRGPMIPREVIEEYSEKADAIRETFEKEYRPGGDWYQERADALNANWYDFVIAAFRACYGE